MNCTRVSVRTVAKMIILLGIAILVGPGIRTAVLMLRPLVPTYPNTLEIERAVSLKLPSSTRLVRSEETDWKGQILKAKISIDQTDLEPFLKSLNSAQKVDSELVYKMGGGNPKWWDPDSVTRPSLMFIERPHNQVGRNELWMLIAPRRNGRVVLYLYMEKELRLTAH